MLVASAKRRDEKRGRKMAKPIIQGKGQIKCVICGVKTDYYSSERIQTGRGIVCSPKCKKQANRPSRHFR